MTAESPYGIKNYIRVLFHFQKLEKQGSVMPGEKPATVSIPHSLTMLSPVRIASMSEVSQYVFLCILIGLFAVLFDWPGVYVFFVCFF